jgi:hypothetical protein
MEQMEITVKELIENQREWKINVINGTKAIPNGEYQLYKRTVKAIQTISFKQAIEFLQKGKAEIIK